MPDLADLKPQQLAQRLGQELHAKNGVIVTAESCTGGGIATAITAVSGSSAWFAGGFVTYANAAKIAMLDVTPEALAKHGAVSQAVAEQMALGALAKSHQILDNPPQVIIAVSATGIAGPTGGSAEKPVGTVWLAWAIHTQPAHEPRKNSERDKDNIRLYAQHYCFAGDRESVRQQTITTALAKASQLLNNST